MTGKTRSYHLGCGESLFTHYNLLHRDEHAGAVKCKQDRKHYVNTKQLRQPVKD